MQACELLLTMGLDWFVYPYSHEYFLHMYQHFTGFLVRNKKHFIHFMQRGLDRNHRTLLYVYTRNELPGL